MIFLSFLNPDIGIEIGFVYVSVFLCRRASALSNAEFSFYHETSLSFVELGRYLPQLFARTK